MANLVPFGKATHRVGFNIRSANGELTAPDSLPTILNVQKNGADTVETAVTVEQKQDSTPAPVIGAFELVLDLSVGGLNVLPGDHLSVVVVTTVGGAPVNAVADVTIAEFATDKPEMIIG